MSETKCDECGHKFGCVPYGNCDIYDVTCQTNVVDVRDGAVVYLFNGRVVRWGGVSVTHNGNFPVAGDRPHA